jgi:molybdenum cofactor synthesis domain-containing protein
VAIISSGDELVPIERVPKPGQVRDLNAVALGSLIKVWGGEPNYYGIAPDDDSILFNLAQEALKNSDVLVISGGSSAGQRDYTIKTFQALPGAQILAHGVAMSPGKPLILGVIAGDQGVGLGRDPENALNNRYDYEIGHEIDQGVDQSRRLANVRYNDQNNPLAKVDTKDDAKVEANIRPNARLQSLWGLPGHPAGALITAEVFLRPLLARLLGLETAPWPTTLKARMSRPVFSAQGRRDYLRVTLSRDSGGELVASPILGKSALITTITQAAALAICPEDLEGLAAGDWAEIQPLTPGGWLF